MSYEYENNKWCIYAHTNTVSLTLDDGEQDNDDEEEEGDIKHDTVHLRGIPIGGLNLVTWKIRVGEDS